MKQLVNTEASIINVSNDASKTSGRLFSNKLNKKRSAKKILRGANKVNDLEVEIKSGCTNLRFSVGSYHGIIIPILNHGT